MSALLEMCVYCGKEIWGESGNWMHEDTGKGSAPDDQWCHVAADNLHHHEPLLHDPLPKPPEFGDYDDADGPPVCERCGEECHHCSFDFEDDA